MYATVEESTQLNFGSTLPATISQEKALLVLSKAESAFAAIWGGTPVSATTEEIAQYYEVETSEILAILERHWDELKNELDGDDAWTPRAALRIGMLLNCCLGTEIRSLALDVIEALTNKEKRKRVTTLLKNSHFVGWSNVELSKIAECNDKTIGKYRKELELGSEIPNLESRVCRDKRGRVYKQSSTKAIKSNPLDTDPEELLRAEHLESIRSQESGVFTETELNSRIAQAVESALIARKVELEEAAQLQVEEQLRTSRALAADLREKNTQLQLEIDQLQSLRQLEHENLSLRQEIEELKNQLQRGAMSAWDKSVFNAEAAKVLNREVAAQLEKFPPELHLRSLAKDHKSASSQTEVLGLVGQLLENLTQEALAEYRQCLSKAQTWQDFEEIAQKWLPVKTVIWSALTPSERMKVRQLRESGSMGARGQGSMGENLYLCSSPTPPTPHSPDQELQEAIVKVGSSVIYRGSAYDAQSNCDGVVIATVFSDFKIRWQRADGSFFESRHNREEIELIKEAVA